MQLIHQNDPILLGSDQAAQTLCKVILRIQRQWEFNNAQMAKLLHVGANTYGNWLKSGRIPARERLSPEMEAVIALIAMHRSLSAMFRNPRDQVLWLQTEHPDFVELSPLDWAERSLADLFYLRSYLDFVRGQGA